MYLTRIHAEDVLQNEKFIELERVLADLDYAFRDELIPIRGSERANYLMHGICQGHNYFYLDQTSKKDRASLHYEVGINFIMGYIDDREVYEITRTYDMLESDYEHTLIEMGELLLAGWRQLYRQTRHIKGRIHSVAYAPEVEQIHVYHD